LAGFADFAGLDAFDDFLISVNSLIKRAPIAAAAALPADFTAFEDALFFLPLPSPPSAIAATAALAPIASSSPTNGWSASFHRASAALPAAFLTVFRLDLGAALATAFTTLATFLFAFGAAAVFALAI